MHSITKGAVYRGHRGHLRRVTEVALSEKGVTITWVRVGAVEYGARRQGTCLASTWDTWCDRREY